MEKLPFPQDQVNSGTAEERAVAILNHGQNDLIEEMEDPIRRFRAQANLDAVIGKILAPPSSDK